MPGLKEETYSPVQKVKNVVQTVWEILMLASRLLALFVLTIYLPALVFAGLLIIATSPGPVFVSKAYKRLNGSVVYLYEFRTECWTTWQETPVGKFLRHADLARLPRLANVLLGHVDVGERVERVNA
jgi:lipopolysaccharide/colanic/teichoic acid biosynthesis glycosyltransferase